MTHDPAKRWRSTALIVVCSMALLAVGAIQLGQAGAQPRADLADSVLAGSVLTFSDPADSDPADSDLTGSDLIGTAVVGALLSVVALGYYLRVIVVLYMQPAPAELAPPTTRRSATAGLATVLCCAGVLAMGLLPRLFLG